MRIEIEFDVEGLPPKKDGSSSMWGKPTELPRLVRLRQAACVAFAGRDPLADEIHLSVEVFLAGANAREVGDLDNFITGICDGLMAAGGTFRAGPEWGAPGLEGVHPNRCVAIVDDAAVVEIAARKIPESGRDHYRVRLSGAVPA